jgi:hypothetical protein
MLLLSGVALALPLQLKSNPVFTLCTTPCRWYWPRFLPLAGATRVMVELWNENAVSDDLIGRCDMAVPAKSALNQPAKSRFFTLDSGGEVGLSIALSDK